MPDLDLFGEVIVTLDDVEQWMRLVPKYDGRERANHIKDYITNYDVINKIKIFKASGDFESIDTSNKFDVLSLADKLEYLIRPKYKPCAYIPYSLYKKRLAKQKLAADKLIADQKLAA